MLDTFRSHGHTNLDTSSMYPFSEDRLGKAGAPGKFTIHTKVLSGFPGAHQASKVQESIEKSLHDLQTSTVETMFLHVPDRETPFEETAKAMNEAFQQGKFKHFGLSNYTAQEVQEFVDICKENGYVRPSVYQGHYNALARKGEKELFPVLRKNNIAFFGFRYVSKAIGAEIPS